MLKTMSSFLAICAVGVYMAAAQPAAPRHEGPGKGVAAAHEGVMKKLNLTEDQQSKMQKMRIDMMKKQTELRSKVRMLLLDTKELFLSDKVDRAAVEKNIKAISDAQQQMKLNLLDHWFAVNSMLTPDQQKIWKKVPVEMGERMRGGGGRFGMRDGTGMQRGMGMWEKRDGVPGGN